MASLPETAHSRHSLSDCSTHPPFSQPPYFSLPAVLPIALSQLGCMGGRCAPPKAAVDSSSSWEVTWRCHSPSVTGLWFLAVGPPLHEETWETFRCGRAVACGLLDGSGQGSDISCPVAGWGVRLTASFLGL